MLNTEVIAQYSLIGSVQNSSSSIREFVGVQMYSIRACYSNLANEN